jgi:hypothetical protein
VTVAFVFLAGRFFAGDIVTSNLRNALESANGATVDLDGAELDLQEGRLTLTGLAVGHPNALDRDLFRAEKLGADVCGANLLRKRLQLDRVVITGATSGEARRVPGRRTATAAEPAKPMQWPDAKGLGDYLENAQVRR